MTSEKLLATLQTVEQDHQIVLHKIAALKECIGTLLRPSEGDLHKVLRRLKEVNDYLETNFTTHLLEEEMTLFPLLAEFKPEGLNLVDRLRREHEEIRTKREEFASCLTIALEVEDTLPRAVVRDLLIDAWELWDILDEHAHEETQAVQECFGQFLWEFGREHVETATS
jgi:iron-sulfur cluster repair protein YtfE (RIC family)